MKMYLISENSETRTGLRLVGISGSGIYTQEELKAELDKALADKEIAILLITEEISKQFPAIIKDIKVNRRLPLIVEIPDRHGMLRSSDFISQYVREAIGVKL